MATLEAPVRSLAESVRDWISLYVEGYKSADDLNDALPDTTVLDESGESDAMDLVMLVIGYLAEYQAGDRTDEELREALRQHASWSPQRQNEITLTAASEERERAAADRRLQVEYES
jgi:uncharacterized membrane protein